MSELKLLNGEEIRIYIYMEAKNSMIKLYMLISLYDMAEIFCRTNKKKRMQLHVDEGNGKFGMIRTLISPTDH